MNNIKIVNFAVFSDDTKKEIEKFGTVVNYGAAIGEDKDPSELDMINILSKENPEILIVNSAPVSKNVIDVLENAKLIICARGNPINVDTLYCKEKNIPVSHTPGRNANGVAEYTICMMISILRNITESVMAINNKECTVNIPLDEINMSQKDVVWTHPSITYEPYYKFMGNEIMGKTLGLIGFGFIGQKVAQKAKALDMNVIVYDPYLDKDLFKKYGVTNLSFNEILKTSDIISLHAKASSEYLIKKEHFEIMKNNVILINTARSALIDNNALLQALKEKKIKGAVLDVFPYEPLSSYDTILEPIEGLILTPHIAGATEDVVKHQSNMIVETLKAYFNLEPIPYLSK